MNHILAEQVVVLYDQRTHDVGSGFITILGPFGRPVGCTARCRDIVLGENVQETLL